MKRSILSLAASLAFASILGAQTSLPPISPAQQAEYAKILKSVDAQANFDTSDLSATITIVSTKPGKDQTKTEAKYFRRDKDKKFLVLLLQPQVQKGQGYLQVDDSTWFYDPESREFSFFSLKDNFGDSEARNDDFRSSSLADDYTVVQAEASTLGKLEVNILTLQAKNDKVAFPRTKVWIEKGSNLLRKTEDYSLSNRLMRTQYYPSYAQVGSRYIPTKMLFVDNLNEGEKSEMSLRDISTGNIPDNIFTKQYVERVNNR